MQVIDEHSGLAEGTTVKYGWSTNTTEEPTSWQELTLSGYVSGTNNVTFTAVVTEADALSGKYYLWVQPVSVKDTLETEENVQTQTQKSESTYWLDNLAPTIELESQGSTGWTSNLSVDIQIKEEHSGLNSGASLQYGWSSSNLEEPTVWKTASSPEYTAGTTEGIAFTATSEGVAGKYYLWVKPVSLSDTSAEGGNVQSTTTISTGTFNLDNIAPTIIIDSDAETFTASTITADNYGGYVTNYASSDSAAQQSVGWRIFHTDGTNIYLIADDYVETQYIPAGQENSDVDKDGTYAISFTNVIMDYYGLADISEDHPTQKWLTQFLNGASTDEYDNLAMKATLYLLDTNVWNEGFANSYAEYAIGSPTIELFTASYNKTHTEKTLETQVLNADNGYGYDIKWNNGNYGEYAVDGLDTTESLYIISNTYEETVYGMWIASPSADEHCINYGGSLMEVHSKGLISYNDYDYTVNRCSSNCCPKI